MCNVSDHEPWWLTLAPIVGYEDDDDSDSSDDDDSSDDSDDEEESEEDSEEESEDEEDEEEDEDKPVTQKDIKNLKSALQKERKARKLAERDLRKARAAAKKPPEKDKSKDNGESDKGEKDEDKGPSEREKRLAVKLRDQAVDAAIQKRASRMNFVDMDDVLRLVDRSDFDVSQDDDDPTDVIIDEDSIDDALKQLAKKKKYLVASTDGKNPKSGSKMSGKRKSKDGPTDEELRNKYRALRQ